MILGLIQILLRLNSRNAFISLTPVLLTAGALLAGCSPSNSEKGHGSQKPEAANSIQDKSKRMAVSSQREARLATASSLHDEGIRHSTSGNSRAALTCFTEAYNVRRELLGLQNTNTYASLERLAFEQTSRTKAGETLSLLAELENAATNLFVGQELTNRLRAVCERQILAYEKLGRNTEANLIQGKLLRLSGLSDAEIAQRAEIMKTVEQQAQSTQKAMEQWATQMTSSLLPRLAAVMQTNLSSLSRLPAASSPARQGYSQAESNLVVDQRTAMTTLMSSLLTNMQKHAQRSTNVQKSEAGQMNIFRESMTDVAHQYSNVFASMLTNTNRRAVRPLEPWFRQKWAGWNGAFERGMPFARLMGQKTYSDPLARIPGNLILAAPDMALVALNLKGIVLDREMRLQTALAASSDPTVAAWRKKLTDLQVESIRSRPKPVDPSADGYAPRQVLKNSPYTLIESKRIEAEETPLRVMGVALPGAGRRNILTATEISDALPKDGALVEFIRFGQDFGGITRIEEHFGAVVFARDRAPVWIGLGFATNVTALVERYVSMMRQVSPPRSEEVQILLETLYRSVWQPLETAIPPTIKTVFISPDSDLHLLSFSTLRSKGRFLCENYNVAYVTSGRDLLRSGTSSSDNRTVEIWADPDFDAQPSETVSGKTGFGFKFRQVAATRPEAMTLKQLAERESFSVKLHLDKAVLESELRKVNQPYILHLGTHGLFQPIQKNTSDRPWETGGLENQFSGDAALYQSMIALAGANRTITAWLKNDLPAPETDGILVAAEAAQLNLQGTWLVTLSACDTGTGGVGDGESLLGLKSAFIQAGAENVCSSLWRVNDVYGADFVRLFYQRALSTKNASLALAEVQRSELKRLAGAAKPDSIWQAVKLAGPFVVTARGQ